MLTADPEEEGPSQNLGNNLEIKKSGIHCRGAKGANHGWTGIEGKC